MLSDALDKEALALKLALDKEAMTLNKEAVALKFALDASRQHEHDRQIVLEQKRRIELHLAREEANLKQQQQQQQKKKQQLEFEKQMMQEKAALAAAAAAAKNVALYRAVEEVVLYEAAAARKLDRERMLLEESLYQQAVRNTRERVMKQQAARLQEAAEAKMRMRKKVWEVEDAAVARAVEESIVSEAAKKLLDEKEERERRRVEAAVRERVRVEQEARRAQEERLRKLKGRGKDRYWDWARMVNGWGVDDGLLLGGKNEMRARVGEESRLPLPPYAMDSYSLCDGIGENGERLPEPTWYHSNGLPKAGGRRLDESERDTQGMGLWDREVEVDRLGETEAAMWRDEREDTRRWREVTTERLETIIRREEGEQNKYRRCRGPF